MGEISFFAPQVVITSAVFQPDHTGHWVKPGLTTQVFPVPEVSYEGLLRIVEVCAGFGIVDEGFRACGAEVIAMVEQNPRYCAWAKAHHKCPAIEADIHDPAVIPKLLGLIQDSHVLSGGTACQPFSRLGDQRQADDDRSRSLPGLLRVAYMLSSVAVIIERTPEAHGSPWVQACLREFIEITGYQCRQITMHLHTMWPARRSRWWAILAHPSIHLPELAPLYQVIGSNHP